jgi:integrase/recombinase XerD
MSETNTVSPLRQRMIEDMAARKLNPNTQRSHIYSCKRFAAWLKRSPDTATPDEVRGFQLHLIESRTSICNRNRIMTGVRFLFRVTLRRYDLAAEVWHIKEPERLPPVLSPEEVNRVLTMATSLKARAMLTLAYGCGLRAGEVVRLRAGGQRSRRNASATQDHLSLRTQALPYWVSNLYITTKATRLAKISRAGREFRIIGLTEERAADRAG